MAHFFHYLHHLWFDPISAAEKFEAGIVLGLPIMAVIVIWMIIWAAFWERYTEEDR